jgi:hypothetical protein
MPTGVKRDMSRKASTDCIAPQGARDPSDQVPIAAAPILPTGAFSHVQP